MSPRVSRICLGYAEGEEYVLSELQFCQGQSFCLWEKQFNLLLPVVAHDCDRWHQIPKMRGSCHGTKATVCMSVTLLHASALHASAFSCVSFCMHQLCHAEASSRASIANIHHNPVCHNPIPPASLWPLCANTPLASCLILAETASSGSVLRLRRHVVH